MKKFKQLAALLLAFVMVVGMFSTPKVAMAAEDLATTTLKDTAVLINYTTEELEIVKEASQTIYFTMKYDEKNHAKAVWEEAVCEGTSATIDFSNTSPAKDVYIWLTDDTDKKPIKIVLKAQETTLKVTFSGTADTTDKSKIKVKNNWTLLNEQIDTFKDFKVTTANPWPYGYLNITVGKGKDAKALLPEELNFVEFKVGNTGSWTPVADLNLRKYATSGAKLSFRIGAIIGKPVVSGGAITSLGRVSKEVSVSYAKQATAPKAVINGVTKEIKLTKAQEYRVGVNGTYTSWINVADNHMNATTKKVDKLYLNQLLTAPVAASGTAWSYAENMDNLSIQVRTAASERGVASKIATVNLNKVDTPTVGSGTAINFTLVKDTSYSKGIKVNNTTGPAIQVAVVSGSSYDVNDTKTVKWINVKATGTATISTKELAKGDTIITRTATIKDVAKTTANEFKVSSAVKEFNYKKDLQPLTQTFKVSDPTISPAVTSASAVGVVTGNAYVVTVTNPASPSAITVNLTVATTNVDNGTPKIVCVASADDKALAAKATNIKLLADGGIASDAGKLKIAITAKATPEDSRTFRVTIDGCTTYVTVNFATK